MFPGPSLLLRPGHWPVGVLRGLTWPTGSLLQGISLSPAAAGCKHSGDTVPAKEAPRSRQWAFRHLSMHQVLRLTLPISVLTKSAGKVGPPRVTLAGAATPKAPNPEPYTFPPRLLGLAASRLQAGRSRAPGCPAGTWPWLQPYHTPLSPGNPGQRGWEEEVAKGRR